MGIDLELINPRFFSCPPTLQLLCIIAPPPKKERNSESFPPHNNGVLLHSSSYNQVLQQAMSCNLHKLVIPL